MSIKEILEIVTTIVVTGTLIVLIYQIRHNTKALHFRIYQRLNDRYVEILWRASEDPKLNSVWDPLPDQRKQQLDKAQSEKEWGAWFELNDDERKQYRLIRLVYETFEQAFIAYTQGWVRKDLWDKWEDSIRVWKQSNFFPYVIEDARPRFRKNFMDVIDDLTGGET